MFEERPLPPVEGRRRTVTKVVIGGYFLVAIAWFVSAALDGGVLRVIFGLIVTVLALGQLWDFRRRTRPELPTVTRRPRPRTGPERPVPARRPRGPRDRTFEEAQAEARRRRGER